MRLLTTMAGWAGVACLLVNLVPMYSQTSSAEAQPRAHEKRQAPAKSVRRCMTFKQSMGSDQTSVDLSLRSGCDFDVVCSLEWQVSCSPSSAGADNSVEKRSTTLEVSERWEVNASAGICEADWEIQDVRWNCVAAGT